MNIDLSGGYGLVTKEATRNPNVSISAKGLYSYLCSFAGDNNSAWPSQSLMCYELGVNVKTLRKLLKELHDADYIEVHRCKLTSNNQWTNNRYTPLK